MDNSIFKRIENAKKPDFGDVLSKSFELYKKTFTMGLTHSLVALAVVIPFMLIVYIPLLPMYMEMLQNAGDPYYQPSAFEDYSPAMIIGWVVLVFIMSFLMQIISFSIYGHYLRALKKADLNTDEEIGGYFTIVKEHFSKLLVLSLAITGIAVLAALLCYLPLFYVMVPLQMILPIFTFNQELSVGDIIKAAFKLGNKFWLLIFGLLFVGGLIASLGVIACYVGIIATMFFSYIVMYYFYKDSVGFEEEDSISEIGKIQGE